VKLGVRMWVGFGGGFMSSLSRRQMLRGVRGGGVGLVGGYVSGYLISSESLAIINCRVYCRVGSKEVS
jgi:hypothetical protein